MGFYNKKEKNNFRSFEKEEEVNLKNEKDKKQVCEKIKSGLIDSVNELVDSDFEIGLVATNKGITFRGIAKSYEEQMANIYILLEAMLLGLESECDGFVLKDFINYVLERKRIESENKKDLKKMIEDLKRINKMFDEMMKEGK